MTTISRQSVKISPRTSELLRLVAALDGRSQAEITEDAVAAYVEERKRSLKARLGEAQRLIDRGGSVEVARQWGRKVAAARK